MYITSTEVKNRTLPKNGDNLVPEELCPKGLLYSNSIDYKMLHPFNTTFGGRGK